MTATACADADPRPFDEHDLVPERRPYPHRAHADAYAPECAAGRPPIDLVGGDADVLAAVLGDPDPRRSDRLISSAGGLAALAACSPVMLVERHGIDAPTAERIAAAFALGRRAAGAPRRDRPQVHSPERAAALLLPLMLGLVQEQLRVLLLDTKNRLLANVLVYQGTVDTCLVREAELLRDAVRYNAPSVIVAHNHPSGDHSPSPEDLLLTRSIIAAGKLLDIAVLDHLIIGAGAFTSLRAHNALRDAFW